MMISPRYHREIPQRYRLEAGQCVACGEIHFPPRAVCRKCGGQDAKTITLPNRGKVTTYTVCWIPPAAFDNQKPYVNAIVELTNGVRLTCMVCEAPPDEVTVGTEVELVFRKLQNEPKWEVIQYGYKARVLPG